MNVTGTAAGLLERYGRVEALKVANTMLGEAVNHEDAKTISAWENVIGILEAVP